MRRFNNHSAGFSLTLLGAILTAVLAWPGVSEAGAPLPAAVIVAPPEPEVPPTIHDLSEVDANGDKIDDALETKVSALENARAQRRVAAPPVDELVSVELVFSAPIGQEHLDQFTKLGGQVTYIYKSVSYGWNGLLPLSLVREAVHLAGPTLVGIVQSRPVQLHLDKATMMGRVRPYVWDSGYEGDSSITIAIMDTGVDESHTDLAGRMEYWKDYTSDASLTPVCIVAHGSHVAGIALGTGAASGVNPTTIQWTDQGKFPSSNGYFYPAQYEFPASITLFNWSTSMVWQTGSGASAQLSQLTVNASTLNYAALFSPIVSSSSPISTTTTNIHNPYPGYLRVYTSYNSSSSGAAGMGYATANTVTAKTGNFGVGDSYYLYRGVAPGCRWAGAKVFPNSGGGASSTDIGEALDDMVTQRAAHNIKVINMSFGYSNGLTDPTMRGKVNTVVDNGIVVCASAGNGGPSGEIADPARAAEAITVGSANDINQLTDYTSIWTDVPGSTEDYKPDLLAPGGSLSSQYGRIMSVDSNDADSVDAGVAGFTDQVPNDYTLMAGTSMASPFAAGCAALVIDAWQTTGHTWSFSSSSDPLFVKMLLCASSTETNQTRESGTYNPTLERAANNPTTGTNKDAYEGYGMINPDAAVDAVTLALANPLNGSLGSTATDRRAVGRFVDLTTGVPITLNLTGMAGGDYDLYLYDSIPDSKGNPVILASSTNAGTNVSESISYTPTAARRAYVLVKRVTGSGAFTLSIGVIPAAPADPQANPSAVCAGGCSTLSATPGSGGDTVEWFTASCGATAVPGGASPSVCPTATTTYYARTKSSSTGCASATCATVTVTVNAGPRAPTGLQAKPAKICAGGCSTLSATPGSGGDTVEWFTAGCGRTPVPGGASPSVCPTATTTYYARTKNSSAGCVSATCATVTVTVNAVPRAPTNPQAYPDTIYAGGCSTLWAMPGWGGDTVEWFTVSCGGTPVPGGASPRVCPTATTTYYARTKCNSTGCVSATCATVSVKVRPKN